MRTFGERLLVLPLVYAFHIEDDKLVIVILVPTPNQLFA